MKVSVWLVVVMVSLSLLGCESTPVKTKAAPGRNISELFEAQFAPSYGFIPQSKTDQNSGYTIGILKLNVTAHFTGQDKNVAGDISGLPAFTSEFAKGLEQILLAKGVGVKGPYDSYDDMTYPDRAQCSYLIKPQLDWEVTAELGPVTALPDYRAPMTEYSKRTLSNVVKCTLRYEIIEPLSNQKLAIHKLESGAISNSGDALIQVATKFKTGPDGKAILGSDGLAQVERKATALELKTNPGYHNLANIDLRALDALFKDYMPKTEKLLSVEEFKHLDTYKKDLGEKKVY